MTRLSRVLLAALLLAACGVAAEEENSVTDIHQAIVQPDVWLNTSRPITAEDLKGRIILLDFWTFCCINCMHVIPDLHYLEKEFGDKLTVIGVHSAKFANERDTENIRAAILRYDIEHPVVNDSQFKVWRSFGINSWPSFVLINAQGRVEQAYAGEGNREALEKDIKRLIDKNAGHINSNPLPLALEKNKEPASVLKFPGKIIYVENFRRQPALMISDSGHNRIVIMALDGKILATVGNGQPGWKDGDAAQARFNHPQGLAYDGDGFLYVADTENHLLRLIDFGDAMSASMDVGNGVVTTLAGTGTQGYMRDARSAPALKTPLASPWDVAFYPNDNHLAIAMAGTHQLWSYDLRAKTVSVIAGSGREDIMDAVAPSASLAQTSGLSAHNGKLYFVDSETSSLRVYDGVRVKTLIGSGLFDFGYKEGKQGEGLLQHPLGVYADDSGIYIADSYNHSIRKYAPDTEYLSDFAGHGVRGSDDGALKNASFNEPNAITRVDDVLYVADTNNNRIRAIDMKNGKVSTLDVQEAERAPPLSDELPNLQKLGVMKMAAGAPIVVHLALNEGWHINHEAPSYMVLYRGSALIKQFTRAQLESKRIALPALDSKQEYRLQGTFYYCKEAAGSQCLIKSVDARFSTQGGQKEVTLKLE